MPGDDIIKKLLHKYPKVKDALRKVYATVKPTPELGESFWKWYALFKESESWPLEQMREHQLDLLRNLLTEAKAKSTFYRERLALVDVEKIDSIDEFARRVPSLTREEFATNYSEIIPGDEPGEPLRKCQTSGTTGTPLQFYHAAIDDERELAAIFHNWNRVGFEPGKSRRVELLGLVQSNRIYEIYPDRNVIRCSILHLKQEHVREYAVAIREYEAEFMAGYPSAISLLASVVEEESIMFPKPKAIFLASEHVYEKQLETISRVFPQATIMAHYGCSERTLLAVWCEHRRDYHILPHYGLVETDESTGEIIATNLVNTFNPFIRYRMNDTVLEQERDPCPDCKRPYVPRIVRIGGRLGDYLYSPEKGFIAPALITYPFRSMTTVREIQVYQAERDSIVLRYIPTGKATEKELEIDLNDMRSRLTRILGKGMTIKAYRVDELPRGTTGKFKWIVSELDEAMLG